jgi:hypothetical protein
MFELIEEHGTERALEIWREREDAWNAENPPPTAEERQNIVAGMRRKEYLKRGTIRV